MRDRAGGDARRVAHVRPEELQHDFLKHVLRLVSTRGRGCSVDCSAVASVACVRAGRLSERRARVRGFVCLTVCVCACVCALVSLRGRVRATVESLRRPYRRHPVPPVPRRRVARGGVGRAEIAEAQPLLQLVRAVADARVPQEAVRQRPTRVCVRVCVCVCV